MGLCVALFTMGLAGYGALRPSGKDAELAATKEDAPALAQAPAAGEEPPGPARASRRRVAGRPARAAQPAATSTRIEADDDAPASSTASKEDDAISQQQRRREDDVAIEQEMKRISIKMYVTQWCPHCTRARAWLSAKGYRFNEYDVEADDRARRVRDQLNPKGSVPTIDVDGVTLVGFSERHVEQTLRDRARRRLGL